MAQIKSALELALEKTAEVKGDTKSLKVTEVINKGRKAASEYLFTHEKAPDDLKEALKKCPKDERSHFVDGIKKVLLSNITLPKNDNSTPMLEKITEGLKTLTSEKKQVGQFMEQLKAFFDQYTENKKQLIEGAKNQYMPRLKQKEQEISERTGQNIQLTPEQDPEFIEFLTQNISRLDDQFSKSLAEALKELEKYLS